MLQLALDDECNLMRWIQLYLNNKYTFLYHGNAFERKIMCCLEDNLNLISNNGHDANPPDFLSPLHNMMFDVMRVNDTEVKKSYNPMKMRERDIIKEIQDLGLFDDSNHNINVFTSSESSDVLEHNFANYKKNVQRVTRDHLMSKGHLNKIQELWVSQNPNIDETDCYFDGDVSYLADNKFGFRYQKDKPVILHEPWNDKYFISWAYESDLDFVVWACCYKPFGTVLSDLKIYFPHIVIMDVRFPRTEKYIDYSNAHLVV
jgi:hypothetical protein